MPPEKDYYTLLGVPRNATPDQLRRAYREAAQRLHPDKNIEPGETELFLEVGQAYEALIDPDSRAAYDATLAEHEAELTAESPFHINVLHSRNKLLRIDEPQVHYTLLELRPSPDLPEVRSDKSARFIRYCDAFNIPIITLVDLPGYLPGVDQEHAGVIRHGAKVLYAYSEATVPKITVILRKAYGGGYIAMNSRHLRADFVFAWPEAEVAVMGPEGAANIIFRKEIATAEDPDKMRAQKVQEYKEKFANPYVAAAKGYIDSVIEPGETRKSLLHALSVSGEKQVGMPMKKHGIPPF